jgi:hypothetical protein
LALYSLVFIIVSFLINVSGTGVSHRIVFEQEKVNYILVQKGNLPTIFQFVRGFISFKQIMGFVLLILFYSLNPFHFQIPQYKSLRRLLFVGGLLLLILMIPIMKLEIGDYGPHRFYSLAFILIVFGILLTKIELKLNFNLLVSATVILLIYLAPKAIETLEFKQAMQSRLEHLKGCKEKNDIQFLVTLIKPPPFLIYTELSKDTNAIENKYWKEYYNLKNSISLKQ